MIHHTSCPVCGSSEIKNILTAKDFTVSQQQFSIAECSNCRLRFTQGVPDAASIGPFYKSDNYISHTNSNKGLINRLYQSVRKKTLKQKRRLVEGKTKIKKGSLLDVGSGTGAFANEMQQKGWQVFALEPDEDARAMAKDLYGIELKELNWLYGLRENIFDAITLWHVLEHVHDLHGCMKQLQNVLKDSGKLFIAVPNYTSKDAEIYGASWAAWDVPRHLYHFSPLSMQKLAEKHGMRIIEHKPMWYDSFYISLLSSKYKNGSTKYFSAFVNGMRSNIAALMNKQKCSSVIYIIERIAPHTAPATTSL